jgi:serine/threonine-protein kinase RsbW
MSRTEGLNARSGLRANFVRSSGGGRPLEIDAWIPSEIKAISPMVERLMRLIEASHSVTGEEYEVELALREALSNAVVHGNRLDARRFVHVLCRCKVGNGISLVISDHGQGFDASAVPDPVAVEDLKSVHGHGIHLMNWAMDQVSFEQGGSEVHMRKRSARNDGSCAKSRAVTERKEKDNANSSASLK